MGHVEKVRFRNAVKVKVQRYAVYDQFSSLDDWDASPEHQRTYIDHGAIRRKPIGRFISNP
jgi:hypothetical protein